jgi:signal transduction histidine kinase
MAKLGQSSFRRILLSRILLLSIPVLLVGEAVTYKKARSGLLETARQNLTESAVRKAESIQASIEALQSNLITASETSVLQSGSSSEFRGFLQQLAQRLPTKVQCIQLTNLQTNRIVSSTCDNPVISPSSVASLWPLQQEQLPTGRSSVHILPAGNALAEGTTTEARAFQKDSTQQTGQRGQLGLVLSAPVYDQAGQLRYALSVQSALHQQEGDKPKSLAGSTVVIDQDGTILAHPDPARVGRKIQQEPDADRLSMILRNAIADDVAVRHFSLEDGSEGLAGYTAVSIPITADKTHKWVVLAVAELDSALDGLTEIKQVLFVLTIGLLTANLLATVYLAQDLARPLEKLGDYALHVQQRQHSFGDAAQPLNPVPGNFKFRELNHLAEALNSMVKRLEDRAEELETAWQEAKAANKLKSEFLANTSHELRTPLNAIIGCVRLVRDECCDDREEEMDFLQRADDAAIHLLSIINDLLDVAKIESGTLSVATEPIDLRQLFKDVIDLQAVHIQQKGLQLTLPDLREPIPVQADPAKLKQVLLNVISNAVKFTDQGSIAIAVRIESAAMELRHERNNAADTYPQDAAPVTNGHSADTAIAPERVVVTVKDTGIGIDPNQQHKLFRPFVMVDGTTTRRFEGTGLGLAISRNLVELMGGTITLHSDGADQGTTVEIALPLIDVSLLPVEARHSESINDINNIAEVTSIGETSAPTHSASPSG